MKYLYTVLLLLCLSVTASGGPLVADRAYGVMHDPTTLKLDYRPEDGDKMHVSVYGHGARYEQLVKSFDTNPELKRLKDSAHFHAIDTTTAMFVENYAASTPAKLTVRIQDADGRVLHEVRDGQIPISPEALIRQCNTAGTLKRKGCPDGQCPLKPQPDRDPTPQPVTPTTPAAPAPRFPWLALALLSLAGTGTGIGIEWHKQYATK
jgi:hypothetical protein